MYEELIERLREYPDREETAGGYVEVDWQDLLDAADAIEALTDQLSALQTKNGELRSALSRVEAERDAARQDCAVAEENHRRAVAERDQIAGWVDLFCEMIEESFGRPASETGGARAALAEIGWRGAQGEVE